MFDAMEESLKTARSAYRLLLGVTAAVGLFAIAAGEQVKFEGMLDELTAISTIPAWDRDALTSRQVLTLEADVKEALGRTKRPLAGDFHIDNIEELFWLSPAPDPRLPLQAHYDYWRTTIAARVIRFDFDRLVTLTDLAIDEAFGPVEETSLIRFIVKPEIWNATDRKQQRTNKIGISILFYAGSSEVRSRQFFQIPITLAELPIPEVLDTSLEPFRTIGLEQTTHHPKGTATLPILPRIAGGLDTVGGYPLRLALPMAVEESAKPDPRVEIVGVSIGTRTFVWFGPLLILLLQLHLVAHTRHVKKILSGNEETVKGFPWMILFSGLPNRALSWLSLVLFPTVAIILVFVRGDQWKWYWIPAVGLLPCVLGVVTAVAALAVRTTNTPP